MARFGLEKWYFDCTAADDVFIGYSARATWGPVRATYGALISSSPNAPTLQRQTLAPGEVSLASDSVSWRNDALAISGEWTQGRRLSEAPLIDGPAGSIRWHCLAANSAVDMTVGDRHITGVGYAERLTMTVPPTRLPFSQLRWGRYISEHRDDFAVWIDMMGELRRTWIWVDGRAPVQGAVDDAGLAVDGAELRFVQSRALLTGNVARDTLGPFAFAAPLLPRGLRSIEQHKRVGSCTLDSAGATSSGLAVFEVVSFR